MILLTIGIGKESLTFGALKLLYLLVKLRMLCKFSSILEVLVALLACVGPSSRADQHVNIKRAFHSKMFLAVLAWKRFFFLGRVCDFVGVQ